MGCISRLIVDKNDTLFSDQVCILWLYASMLNVVSAEGTVINRGRWRRLWTSFYPSAIYTLGSLSRTILLAYKLGPSLFMCDTAVIIECPLQHIGYYYWLCNNTQTCVRYPAKLLQQIEYFMTPAMQSTADFFCEIANQSKVTYCIPSSLVIY